ncbi:rhodanese-like domain-containing protein [Thiohalocapsa marina]|uniref:Rhodanese-like domain-containing protein n=1 Tax=Thiohalocapsa marina TaxID=424902 RepID=A0A5M8FUG1_9GAMM|nr:rhodanese-like domain-containing protein [Thiohalocapsa marina]KAA6187440.1 rhodanese-like domain-containing protein [Thiohalocapsa marina]
MKAVSGTALVLTLVLLSPLPAVASDDAIEAMQDYLDFANYDAGIITPEQLSEDVFRSVHFVDTRDADQFGAGTIPGAVNIEWRQILQRRDELPTERKVVLFCNTGSLSAQATFALRVSGMDNALVLQTGLNGWRERAAYMPAN